jgi:hypothetical protein
MIPCPDRWLYWTAGLLTAGFLRVLWALIGPFLLGLHRKPR